jgi:aspartate/methionine/tyrosine aminotransferase
MATGWKVGWAIGAPKILRLLGIVSNAMNYCTNHPAQIAMAKAMDLARTPNLEKEG